MTKLSIIVPVYNEEKTLERILSNIRSSAIEAYAYEIVLVDDGSTDRSGELIAGLAGQADVVAVSHSVNRGKGAAVRSGIQAASGDILLIQDADLEYDPKDYSKLISPIVEGRAQVVYGTRFSAGRPKAMSMKNHLANRLLTALTNTLYGSRLTDMETCYKVFRSDLIKSLPLKAMKFDIEPEITARLLKQGVDIEECPISYSGRSALEGKKIGWKDGFAALAMLFKLKFSRNDNRLP